MKRSSRHTIDSTREMIDRLRTQETVYKSAVDNLKMVFSRAFEADWDMVKQTKYLSKAHEDRTEDETALYFESPMEARHWYGKKFSKFLEELPESDFKDGAVSHRNRWRPLFTALEELKARQVKGRKPVEKKVVATRTQLRAICPCCFKQHAVKADRLVAHGYTLDYGFQNGTCSGAGKKHFGTEAGRDEAARMAENARSQGDAMLQASEDVLANPDKYTIRDYRARPIENPKAGHIKEHAQRISRNGEGLIRYAEEVTKLVENWVPADAVAVEVEITE